MVTLNAVNGHQRSELFQGKSWDSDLLLQLYAVQIIPCAAFSVPILGAALPLLYPNAPWLLVNNIDELITLPLIPRLILTALVELLNVAIPAFVSISTSSVFMTTFTVLKMALHRLR